MATARVDSRGQQQSDYLIARCGPAVSPPRPTTTCSSASSQEDDTRDRGYGSNEALRIYEKEIRRGAERTPSGVMDEAGQSSRFSRLKAGSYFVRMPKLSQTRRQQKSSLRKVEFA